MEACAGPLFWYDVPADDGGDDSVALIECGCCGGIFVTSLPPDARHADTLVYRA